MVSKMNLIGYFRLCFFALLVASPIFCQRFQKQVNQDSSEIAGFHDYVAITETEVKRGDQKVLFKSRVKRQVKEPDFTATYPPDSYFVSTTLETTPMVYFGGKLSKDDDCTAYGEAIHDVQTSIGQQVEEKKKKLTGEDTIVQFGSKICNWAKYRLECVPSEHRGVKPKPGPPGPGKKSLLKGTCQCMRALGEKAIWFKDTDPKKSKCYIPADMGSYSDCGYDINLPYGEIDEGVKSKKFVASAGAMCVPQSACTTGYEYVGLRCHCKKGTKLDRKLGLCNKGHSFTYPGGVIFVIIAIFNYLIMM